MHSEYKLTEETLPDPWHKEHIRSNSVNINRVYWIAFWANLGLAVFKITIGALGYSRLLIIDGLNSSANAVVVTMVLFGIHMSRPHTVSEDYHYGTGKAQFLATLVVGFLLAVAASMLLVFSVKTFFLPASLEPVGVGLATALISIGGNLTLLRFLKHVDSSYENDEIKNIARLQSVNIAASTVLANSLILSGLLGWFVAERLGSLSISIIVVWLSIRIIKSSLDGIMDRSSGEKMESWIGAVAGSVDQVEEVKLVRTRRAGQNLCVDIQVGISGDCTIRQSDRIAAQIRKRLFSEINGIPHVIAVDCYPV